MEERLKNILKWVFFVLGVLTILSALPQKTLSEIDLGLFKINLGTQLDLIRLIVGVILIIIGKNLKKYI